MAYKRQNPLIADRLQVLSMVRRIYPAKYNRLRNTNRLDIALAIGYAIRGGLKSK